MQVNRFLMPVVVSWSLAGCGDDGGACEVDPTYHPAIDPAAFVDGVTNPLFPLVPGTTWVYESENEEVVVTVTDQRKEILGISAVVVHDVASEGGEVIEDTLDYYAQDQAGNVWYLGEDTQELEGGEVVSTEGSWLAGEDGAEPGVLIPAAPSIGVRYRQEYLACEAEDMGEVVAFDQAVTVPAGSFDGCLETLDVTPLEPGVAEHKFYCPGTGLVSSVDLVTGAREDLVEVREP